MFFWHPRGGGGAKDLHKAQPLYILLEIELSMLRAKIIKLMFGDFNKAFYHVWAWHLTITVGHVN